MVQSAFRRSTCNDVRLGKMKLFFTIMLPVIWVGAAAVSYFYPGDEYGIFVFSTIAGSWVCFCMDSIGHIGDVLWIIFATGVSILAVLGFLMDRLRVSKRVWGALFVLFFAVVLVLNLSQYPSLDRAISKNDSLTAYLAGACNIGLYLSIVSVSIFKVIAAAAKMIDTRSKVEQSNGGAAERLRAPHS